MKGMLVIVSLVALCGTASIARADPSPAAEVLYAQGQIAYARADYVTAIDKWQGAYDLSGESALLFNLAQAYRLSGDCARAIETYRRFVIADPAAGTRALAEDLVRELTSTCVKRPEPLVVVKPPTTPSVDAPTGKDRGTVPGQTLRIAGLVTGGAGAVSLAIGIAIGHHASRIGAEVTSACAVSCDWAVQRSKDTAGRRDATIGYALDAVGVATIAGGALMYYLGERTITVEPLSAQPGARGGIVAWSGAW